MAVSYQNVADAAQALIDEGKNLSEITVRRVRSELGTGSNGTITPFLARWKRTQEDKAESSSINLLSTELQNLLNAEIGRLLKKAKETSSRRIADLEKLLEETSVNLQASEHKNTKDSKLIQTLNSSLESLEKQKIALTEKIESSQTQLNKALITAAEERVKNQATEKSQENLIADNESLRMELAAVRNHLTKSEKEQAVAQARLEERSLAKKQ